MTIRETSNKAKDMNLISLWVRMFYGWVKHLIMTILQLGGWKRHKLNQERKQVREVLTFRFYWEKSQSSCPSDDRLVLYLLKMVGYKYN